MLKEIENPWVKGPFPGDNDQDDEPIEDSEEEYEPDWDLLSKDSRMERWDEE